MDVPPRHRVAPYGIFFRPEGHGYLDATLLEVTHRARDLAGSLEGRETLVGGLPVGVAALIVAFWPALMGKDKVSTTTTVTEVSA